MSDDQVPAEVDLGHKVAMPMVGFGTWQLRGSAAYEPVRYALEEGEHAEHHVAVRWLGQFVDRRPHESRGAVEPGVRVVMFVQQAGDLPGLDQRGRVSLGRHPPGRVRSL